MFITYPQKIKVYHPKKIEFFYMENLKLKPKLHVEKKYYKSD